MTTLTQEVASDGQIKLITRMASDAAEKAVKDYFAGTTVSKEGAERVKGSSDFAARIREAATLALTDLSITDKFKDEEVASNYGYLSGYNKPHGLTQQCNKLREHFSGIGFPNMDLLAQIEKGEVELPKGAEGWFAIPNVWGSESIRKQFGGSYHAAVEKALGKLKDTRNGKFYNYRAGEIDGEHLRQSKRTEEFFVALSEAQGNPDILIIAAQFGIRHRGRSVRRAREVFAVGEVGLGAFAVGIMLLTHPERLQHYDDLWIDCAGDEWKWGDEREFSRAPYFRFNDGGLEFGTRRVGNAYGYFGSASVSLPQ